MSRVLPRPGMAVEIRYLGATEERTIDAVHDEGRTLVVGDQRFTLRPLNGHFIREDEPSYGTRATLMPDGG